MCYKTSLDPNQLTIEQRFAAEFDFNLNDLPTGPVQAQTRPFTPIILDDAPAVITTGQWGLVPHFAKDDPAGFLKKTATYNAKIETIEKLASFRGCTNHRCLILADAFYEWKHVGAGKELKKLPYKLVVPGGGPFAIAGIFSMATGVPTYSVLTTGANTLMAEIHNTKKRMPVVLMPAEEKLWMQRERFEPFHSRDEFELQAIPLFEPPAQTALF